MTIPLTETRTLLVMLCMAMTMLLPLTARAATATWQANTEPDLAGYNLYRAEGTCATPGQFAKVTTYPKEATSGAVPNPPKDGKHCHKLTAFDTANNESLFSNTAEFEYNVNPPAAPQGLSVKP